MQGFVALSSAPHDLEVDKSIHSEQSRVMSRMLRRLRVDSGMLQVDFAEKIGEVRQTVSAIERGERMLGVLELFPYLQPLGLKPSEFLVKLETELARQEEMPESDDVNG